MYLYNNLQKIITLHRYNDQKGSPHINATNYNDRQQNKRFTLLSEYFNKPPRVLTINRECNVAVREVTDPEYGTLVEYSEKRTQVFSKKL